MRKVITIAVFAIITVVAAVFASGCSGVTDSGSTPTPTVVYGPVTTPTPTPAPTPVPLPAASKSSEAVKIIFNPIPWKAVEDAKTLDGKQYETIHLVVINDGAETAKKVALTVKLVDRRTMNTLDSFDYPVGDLAAGEFHALDITSGTHDPANLVWLIVRVHWGDFGEYYNPNDFPQRGSDTFSFPL